MKLARRDTCKHGALLTEDCEECWYGYSPADSGTDSDEESSNENAD